MSSSSFLWLATVASIACGAMGESVGTPLASSFPRRLWIAAVKHPHAGSRELAGHKWPRAERTVYQRWQSQGRSGANHRSVWSQHASARLNPRKAPAGDHRIGACELVGAAAAVAAHVARTRPADLIISLLSGARTSSPRYSPAGHEDVRGQTGGDDVGCLD